MVMCVNSRPLSISARDYLGGAPYSARVAIVLFLLQIMHAAGNRGTEMHVSGSLETGFQGADFGPARTGILADFAAEFGEFDFGAQFDLV